MERRQVIVLFVDLVGSSRLAATLDPEDFGALISGYRSAAAAEIESRGGFVVRYIGDGVVACWGYPRSREHDSRRAIASALAIVAAMEGINREEIVPGVRLSVRIAIDSGVVVVGQIGPSLAGTREIVGEAPTIASRVQQLAEANTVLVTEAVREMAGQNFEFEPRGSHNLRGISEPVTVYRAIDKRPDSDLTSEASSAIFGRDSEQAWLDEHWRIVERGRGQTVAIIGEPGIGKTALVGELRRKLSERAERSLVCHCFEEGQLTPLLPVCDLVRQTIGLAAFSDTKTVRRRITAIAARDGLDRGSSLQILTPLLDARSGSMVNFQSHPQLNPVSFIAEWFATLAARAPMLIVVEDVHWADETSIRFFELLSQRASAARLLLILTSRTSFKERTFRGAETSVLPLGPLNDATVEKLVTRLAGTKGTEVGMERAIARRAEGNPFFAGELVQLAARARPLGRPPDLLVFPSTLNASLLARLDDLGELRWVAQTAAVIGRDFDALVLAKVLELSLADLKPKLEELIAAGILSVTREGLSATHTFKHSLIREAAYSSLLKARRAVLHGKTANVIVTEFPLAAQQHPELVAQHFEGTSFYTEAVRWWALAGEQAGRRSVTTDAIRLLERARALCARLPKQAASLARAQVLNSLGVQYIAAYGYASAAVERVFGEAVAVLDGGEDASQPLLFALWGLNAHSMVRGDVPRALALGAQILRLAESAGDADMLLQGHRVQGLASLLSALHDATANHCHALLERYDSAAHEHHRYRFGGDPKALALAQLAWSEWIMGRIESSDRHANEAVALARSLAHPHTLVYALGVNSLRLLTANDSELAEAVAGETREIAAKHGFSYWIAWSDIVLAAAWGTADPNRADSLLGVAIDRYQLTGARQLIPFALARKAECLIDLHRTEMARGLIDEGLSLVETTGVRLYQAELLRLRGLAYQLDGLSGLDDLAAAADLALRQGALSFVLRSLIAMGDCAGREGLPAGERLRLAETIHRMEGAPETAEMKRARALV
jgi:predicted ATPase/class 3 adenylate cyclase